MTDDAARSRRQIAHDLASPIATFTMELHSLRALLGELEPAVATEDGKLALAELNEICRNLHAASTKLADYVATQLVSGGNRP